LVGIFSVLKQKKYIPFDSDVIYNIESGEVSIPTFTITSESKENPLLE